MKNVSFYQLQAVLLNIKLYEQISFYFYKKKKEKKTSTSSGNLLSYGSLYVESLNEINKLIFATREGNVYLLAKETRGYAEHSSSGKADTINKR